MEQAWLLPALCAASFVLIVFLRKVLPKEGAWIAPIAVAAGFLIFWAVFRDLLRTGHVGEFSFTWLQVSDVVTIAWGMYLDNFAVLMLGLVTFVALCVQIYSWSYMHGEPRFGWYFAVHSLFAASMLTLVIADNLLLMYFAWELVGACSYLLIGFYYERRSAAEAAKKAFITTRIGDVGMLIGILVLYRATGTFNIQGIIHAAEAGGIAANTLTLSMLLLFAGAVGKSAQFPLHVWLPDAMEGPTPVSALIHAATMVVAGVYLVARMFPAFEVAPHVLGIVATVGLITALLMSFLAVVMTDIKRVLAYSTVSHLGFMMLALGSFGVGAAIFHLFAHAFAKAMLFLSAGSVSHGVHGKLDMREMGGLRSKMPITFLCMTIGALSLAGLFPLSGFFSKDEILDSVLMGRGPIFLALTMVAAFFSAFYMARLVLVVFTGKPRSHEAEHGHESPPLMVIPLVVLAILTIAFTAFVFPIFPGYDGFAHWVTHEGEAAELKLWLAGLSTLVAISGLGLACMMYGKKSISPASFRSRYPGVQQMLENKYYMDAFYQWIINNIVLGLGRAVALFDRIIVNDAGVNGSGESIVQSGNKLKLHITGQLPSYALAMTLGVIALGVIWWLFAVKL